MDTEQAERELQVHKQTKVLESQADRLASLAAQFASRLGPLMRPEAKEDAGRPEEHLVDYAARLRTISSSVEASLENLAGILNVLEF